VAGGTMTGDLTIPDKIIHSGDTNTAIRFPSADTVTVETGGSERMRVDSSGNVGIGENNPTTPIEVKKNVSATGLGSNPLITVHNPNSTGFGTKSEIVFKTIGVVTAGISSSYTSFASGGNYGSDLIFSTKAAADASIVERARIIATGNVGIGTTTPATKLDVNGDVTITDKIIHSGDTNTAIRFPAADTVTVETGGVERIRVDSAGLAVNAGVYFVKLSGTAIDVSSANGATPLLKMVGIGAADYIQVDTNKFVVKSTGNVGIGTASPANPLTVNGIVSPSTDDTRTLGTASLRWSEVFAGNGTINTSDATEKQDVAELNEAEQQVATALKGLIRKYRWISSVAEKGDDARIHVGVMAQDVKQAFTDAGLDAERYGVYCKDVWYTKQTEEGEAIYCESNDPDANEHVRYGVRYDQLFAFIISAL
jgi:hypothetical protein